MTDAKIEIKMRFATAKKQNKAIYEKKASAISTIKKTEGIE
jgi:hypothetical protein